MYQEQTRSFGKNTDFEKEENLHVWLHENSYGVNGLSGIDNPGSFSKELWESISYNFKQFNVRELPPDLVKDIAMRVFFNIDYFDPYLQFCSGLGGVTVSGESYKKSYAIINSLSGQSHRADPERVEVFKLTKPHADIEMFNIMMSNPGFANSANALDLFYEMESIGSSVFGESCYSDYHVVEGYLFDEHPNKVNSDRMEELCIYFGKHVNLKAAKKLCKELQFFYNHNPRRKEDEKDLSMDTKVALSKVSPEVRMIYQGIDLVMWSFMCWYYGPTQAARETRMYNPIYEGCYQHGEVLGYDYGFFTPDNYITFDIHPLGCVSCGVVAWCVQLCQIETQTVNQCEACVNGSQPIFNGVDCGSKICKYIECPNHYLHGTQMAMLEAYRRGGQLNKFKDQNNAIEHQVFKQLA